jgi:hypothetical protein
MRLFPLRLAAAALAVLATAGGLGPASSAQAQQTPAIGLVVPASGQRNFEADYGIHLGMMGQVGEARLRINTNGPNYAAVFNREASGVARWAVGNSQDYKQNARGSMTPEGLRPQSYERSGGRRGRVVRVAFTGADVVTTATPALGSMGNPPASRAQRLEAIDDVSAFVAMVFGVVGADPCARTIRIYDGRQRYDLALRPNGTQRVNIQGFRGEARRCSVSYRPLAGFTDPTSAKNGMTFVFAPMNHGAAWAPVRVETVMDDDGVAVLQATRVRLY